MGRKFHYSLLTTSKLRSRGFKRDPDWGRVELGTTSAYVEMGLKDLQDRHKFQQ